MQKLYQSCYVSHNETLKPDKRFCYDFVIRMFFHLASFFGSSTADYLVPRPSIPHRGTASVYLLLLVPEAMVQNVVENGFKWFQMEQVIEMVICLCDLQLIKDSVGYQTMR